jgi:hypothetical protein
VSDEYIVFHGNAGTDERVTGDFAAVANLDFFLNFHEAANLHVISDFTAIKIGEPVNANAFAQFHIGRNLLDVLL